MNVPTFNIIIGFVLATIGVIELLISIFILFRRERSDSIIAFSLFNLGVAIWVFSNGVARLSPDLNVVFDKLTFVGASIIVSAFVYFSWSFPYKNNNFLKSQIILLFLPTIIFTYALYTSDYLVGGDVVLTKFGYYLMGEGKLYHLFNIYILSFFIWSFINLFKKLKTSDGYHLWQLRTILFALGVAAIFGVFSNLVLPWFFNVSSYYWLGPLFSVVWLGTITYIVVKR